METNLLRRRLLAGISASAFAAVADAAGLTQGGLARLRPRRSGETPPDPGLVSSVTHNGVTWDFAPPTRALVAVGQPVIERVPGLTITTKTPAAATINTVPGGVPYDAYNVMANPYIPFDNLKEGAAPPSIPFTLPIEQAFDKLLSVAGNSSQNSARMPYNAAKGVTLPYEVSGPVSLVVMPRATGMTNPPTSQWRHFEEGSVLHIVDALPGAAFFPPSASALTKRTDLLISHAKKSILGPGRAYVAGQPTQAEVIAQRYISSSFQPFFGQFGEPQRRYMYLPKLGLDYNGYSRDYAIDWANVILAMVCEGADNVDTALFNTCVAVGLGLIGLDERGYKGGAGAGQWAGFFPLMFFAALALEDQDPTLMTKVLTWWSNEIHQYFYVYDAMIGMDVYDYTFNPEHAVNHLTYQESQLGWPGWVHTKLSGLGLPADLAKHHDAQPDGDYALNSAGVANFPGVLAMCSLVGGAVKLARGATLSDPLSAPIAFLDLQRTFIQGSGQSVASTPLLGSGPNIIKEVHQLIYDAYRDSFGVERWVGAPHAMTPYYAATSSFLTAGTNSISWDWSLLKGEDPDFPAIDWETIYSIDEVQWFRVDVDGKTGTQSNLNATLDHRFMVRRASMVNGVKTWGPWTTSMKRQEDDPAPPLVMRPTGSESPTITFTKAPKALYRRYPNWYGRGWTDEIGSVIDVHHDTRVLAGSGYFRGDASGGIAKFHERDGASVSSVMECELQPADLGTSHVVGVTVGGVTARSVAFSVPNRPALAGGDRINIQNVTRGEKLFNWEFFASLAANSVQANDGLTALSISVDTSAQAKATPGEVFAGRIYGAKTTSQPRMRAVYTDRRALAPSTLTFWEVEVAIGAGQSGPAAVNPTWRMGSALAATTASNSGSDNVAVTSFDRTGQPRSQTLSGSFTTGAAQTVGAIMHHLPYSTGGSAGGDLNILRLRVWQ